VTSALGNVLGGALDLVTDVMRKASSPDDGDGESDTGSMALTIAGQGSEKIPPEPTTDSPKGLLYDPFALIDQLGFRDRPSGLTYATLRETAKRVPTYLAIEQTRITQVSGFATPQQDKRDTGFAIKLRDEKATPSKQDKRRMLQLTDWMLNTGSTWGPGRDDFKTFLRKLTRDTLELDQACFEVVRNRKGIPAEFYCLDGATIRLADVPPGAETEANPDVVKYVQVYDEIIIGEFSATDMCFGVRNPRSDIRVNGYGFSEIEMLISVITASLWAYEYNKKFFSQGTSAKGLLNFKGSVPDSKLDGFRRQWQMMLTGVNNAWRTPMTNTDEVQWINLSQNNRDMEYSAWMDFLIKVTCFPAETRVACAGGAFRPIGDLNPGDAVVGHTGREREVKNVQVSKYRGDLIGIRASGRVIRATPEHPFYAVSSRVNSHMAREFDEPEWVKAEDIVEGQDYLLVPRPRVDEGIEAQRIDLLSYSDAIECGDGMIRLDANHVHPVPRHIDLEFEDNAFVLGLYVAEGHSTRNRSTWSFSLQEDAYAQAVEAFGRRHGLSPRRDGDRSINVHLNSSILAQAFRKLFGKRSEGKRIPEEILRASQRVQQAFLSGMIAGDGSVWKTSRQLAVSYSTCSRDLADQLQWMLMGQGIYAGAYEQRRANSFKKEGTRIAFDLRIQGAQLRQMGWLRGPKGDLLRRYLEEFGDRLKQQVYPFQSYFAVPVSETWREPFDGEVYNLEVEGEHTYVVERFAVHNCAVMQFDPAEINFTYGNAGQTSQMFQTPVDQKLKQSKDRGLRPLLDDLAQWLNVNLIWRLDPRYKLVFLGLDAKNASDAADLGKKRSAYLQTVDELRAEDDLAPMPDGKGEVILDPTWLQFAQAKDQAKQQQAGPPGPMGEPPMGPNNAPMPGAPQQEPPGQPSQGGPVEGSDEQMGAIFGGPEEKPEEEEQKSLRGGELRKSIPRVRRTVIRYDVEI
jgi:intein/homing endonuclease